MSDEVVAFFQERGIQITETDRMRTSLAPQVDFEPGLSDSEIERVESCFAFRFPPDLRAFLQTALPVGDRFPNWRDYDETSIREWLVSPLDGVCFDVEHNGFWMAEWGNRPASIETALRTCRALLNEAPRLIPIFAHRFMPGEPSTVGNPVFSILQTDIIPYGFDLEDYLRHEFALGGRKPWPTEVRKIRFWDVESWHEFYATRNG